ncbi:hypothetical protein U1Q18_044329 [Sarracenia purpurea var. burkii]
MGSVKLYPKLLELEGQGSWVPRLERPCPRPYSAAPVTRPLSSAVRIKGGEENGGPRPAVLVAVGKLIDNSLGDPNYERLFNDGLYRSVDVYLKDGLNHISVSSTTLALRICVLLSIPLGLKA